MACPHHSWEMKPRSIRWLQADVMRLVFGIAGLLFLVCGLTGLVSASGQSAGYSLEWFFQVIPIIFCVLGGAFFLRCALSRYQGEWPTFIGIVLILLGMAIFCDEARDYVQGSSAAIDDAIFGVCLLSFCGILLLLSGQRLHSFATKLEAADKPAAPTIEPQAAGGAKAPSDSNAPNGKQ